MRLRPIAPEIDPGGERHAGSFERTHGEAFTVHAEGRAIRVDEEPAGGHDRNTETQRPQRGDQEIAARLELPTAPFEDRQRGPFEAGKRSTLRRRGRRDVQVLRKLLEVPYVPPRSYQPAEAPASHVEILGEAADYESVLSKLERASRFARVRKSEIDLIDDQHAALRCDRGSNPLELVARHHRACWIRGRRDERAASSWRPLARDELRGELIIRR